MSTRIPTLPQRLREAAEWPSLAADLPPPAELGSRATGEIVTDHRSSWVRRLPTGSGAIFIKTYEYATWASRLRDFGRRTAPWGRPRTICEFDALSWLRTHDFEAPLPLAVWAWRCCGFLVRTTLVTEAFPGRTASELLPTLATRERIEVAQAIGAFVQRLHSLGFRDRNLDLRNLLLARTDGSWRVAKIDSPRHRLRTPGAGADALTRADWRRLDSQLAAFDLVDVAHAAAVASAATPRRR